MSPHNICFHEKIGKGSTLKGANFIAKLTGSHKEEIVGW